MKMISIGQVSREIGLSTKTIRYYEEIGLVSPPYRGSNGYRYYSEQSIRELGFIKRAREAGFNLDECLELVQLYRNEARTSAQVKALTLEKIAEVELRIAKMQKMLATLRSMAACCDGGERPDCPIIKKLETG